MSAVYQLLIAGEYPVEGVKGCFLSSGGSVISGAMKISGVTITDGGAAYVGRVYNRGILSDATIEATSASAAQVYISCGGIMSGGSVGPYAYVSVDGGVLSNTKIVGVPGSAANVRAFNGGVINGVEIGSGVATFVFGNAEISDVRFVGSTNIYVFSGGVANGINVNRTATLNVRQGGESYDTILTNGGTERVTFADTVAYDNHPHPVASQTRVYSGGTQIVVSGGSGYGTTVNSGGYLTVSEGGTANSTTINKEGEMYVYSGGVANNTVTNAIYMFLMGGVANSTTVLDQGLLGVISGGTANYTTVNGTLEIQSGGTANYVTVLPGRYLTVYSGGTALAVTSNAGAQIEVKDGGIIEYA